MMVINELQKSIYECLKCQNSQYFQELKGVFTYIEKNIEFPYIFVTIKELKNISTFSKELYCCVVSINVYDKNTTNSFVINITDELKSLFQNIYNFILTGYNIIDIKYDNFNLLLENNNKIWRGEISYNIILEKLNESMLID